MIICAAGDIHGAMDKLYEDVLAFEVELSLRFDWVLHVGDFGVWPDPERVDRATRHHDGAGDFPVWLAERRAAPRRTLFIKGNHEDFVWLDAQPGREVLPNLVYLPNGSRFDLGGITVGGVGGCYGPSHYDCKSQDLQGAAKRHLWGARKPLPFRRVRQGGRGCRGSGGVGRGPRAGPECEASGVRASRRAGTRNAPDRRRSLSRGSEEARTVRRGVESPRADPRTYAQRRSAPGWRSTLGEGSVVRSAVRRFSRSLTVIGIQPPTRSSDGGSEPHGPRSAPPPEGRRALGRQRPPGARIVSTGLGRRRRPRRGRALGRVPSSPVAPNPDSARSAPAPDSMTVRRYRAFISYSHLDKSWGDWLHRALETYRVPKGIVGRSSRDGEVPARLFPIFRDREELPVSADLGSSIAEALGASRYLVVVCSPNAAASRWVNEEILAFKRLGRGDRVLALIVSGEPNATDGKPGVAAGAECFPPALRYQIGDDGALCGLRSEPIAADARDGKDGRSNAKLKLIAGLLGVNFDDLRQRDNERRLKRLRRLVAAAALGVSVFAAIGAYAWRQAAIARQERARADERLADAYGLRARAAAREGDDMAAAVLFAEAYRTHQAEWTAANAMSAVGATAVLRARLPCDGDEIWSGIATEGSRVLAWRSDGPVGVVDLTSAASIGTLPLDKPKQVRSIAWSPDRRSFATLGADEAIRLWRLETLEPIRAISRPDAKWVGVSFSQDGRALIAWDDHAEDRFDVERGDSIGSPRAVDISIDAVSVSPDRTHAVLVDGKNERIQFWDLSARQAIGSPQHALGWSAVWRADGTSVAIREAGKVRDEDAGLWDPATGRKIVTLVGAGSVRSFSPDGATLLTSLEDEAERWLDPRHGAELRLWNTRTGEPVGAPMPHAQDVWSAAFSPDGRHVASASNDRVVRLWSVPGGKPVATLRHADSVQSLLWPTGTTIVCEGLKELTLWDVSRTVREPVGYPVRGPFGAAAFSPDGTRFFTGGQLWDAAALVPVGRDVQPEFRHSFQGFSPDSRYAFSTGLEATAGAPADEMVLMYARAWDARTGAPVGVPLPLAEAWNLYSRIEFTPDGSRVITWMGEVLQVRSVATGQVVGAPIRGVKLRDMALSPDGTEIVGIGEDFVGRRWRVDSGDVIDVGWTLDVDTARLAVAAGRAMTGSPLRLWDLATKRAIATLPSEGSVTSIVFSPDQRRVATVDRAGVRVWSSADGAAIGRTASFGSEISDVAFSPDGRWLAVAAHGNTVHLVDSDTGERVGATIAGGSLANVLAFRPDGRRLMAGSADRGAQLFDVSYLYDRADPDALLRRLRTAAGLSLSPRGEIESIGVAEWRALRDSRD